ncbi:MAG: hypothetical protein RLZZ200_527 [Pseudomonadota bacterium]|jgi:ATP-dependent protease HslVU (ClpYQ) peptidase subunit
MTTVAWDGHTLAADSQVTFGNLVGHCTKAVKLEDGRLLASSGFAEDHFQVKQWLETGGLRGPRHEDPEQPVLDKDYTGILIDGDGAWVIQSNLIRWPLPRKHWAIGSGRDFAIAAMHLGRTAAEGVAIACEFDANTALPVVEVSRTADP